MDQVWGRIAAMAEESNGVIVTSQVEDAGISRPMLKKYVDAGKLERIRKGIYVVSDGFTDEYGLLQIQFSKAVFSYGTALFFWGLSDRTPHIIDITVPQGSNTSIIRRDNEKLRCHYVKNDLYLLGITETKSPQGATVRLYDRERCICDLIRDENQVEKQLYSQALKEYFKCKPNIRRLLKYGKAFGIEKRIRMYMEVLL